MKLFRKRPKDSLPLDGPPELGLFYQAWTVIANGSDWINKPDSEWVEAAKAWRDKYHAYLDSLKSAAISTPTPGAE